MFYRYPILQNLPEPPQISEMEIFVQKLSILDFFGGPGYALAVFPLTHLFLVLPFSSPEKQKTLWFSDVFKDRERWIGKKWV